MIKGFNEEYVLKKLEYYEKLAEEDEKYEDELFIFQIMYATLIFQDGEVNHHEVSIEEFLEAYNDTNNLFPLKNRLMKRVVRQITAKMAQLDHLEKQELQEIIKKEDSFVIVGDFIKEFFGKEHYGFYEKYVLNNRNYILFDKHNTNARIFSTLDDEYFFELMSSENIDFTSSLAHEVGHLVKKVTYGEPKRISFLSEVESFSYEIGLLRWMINKNIYADEAKKKLNNLIELIESLTITRFYDNLYSLHSIKSSAKFRKYVEDNQVLKKANVSTYDDLFNLLGYNVENNFICYLLSYLTTIEILSLPDFLTKYNYILQNLENTSDSRILKMVGLNNITNLSTYQKVRERLKK